MADFRKWLIAFAALALLLSFSTTASAQGVTTPFSCFASAAAPPTVRAEGVTELVGDVVLNCTGGAPTLVGTLIPQSNVTIFLNTNVTSRIVSGGASEALLTIDEPFPSAAQNPTPSSAQPAPNVPQTQSGCVTNNVGTGGILGNCQMYGVVTAAGVNSLTGLPVAGTPPSPPTGNSGPYRGNSYTSGTVTSNSYNIFQGVQTGANQVSWNGVPIDAPGSNGTRFIRITNVRANACQLGVSTTLIPSQIIMVISITGSQGISVNNPTQTVATVVQGLKGANATASYLQCNSVNATLLGGTGSTSAAIPLAAVEGFASAFKVRNYAQVASAATTAGAPNTPTTVNNGPGASGGNSPQNILGTLFYIDTESGIVLSNVPGLASGGTANGSIGEADSGTQITFQLANVPSGLSIFAPPTIPLYASNQVGTNFLPITGAVQTGLAVLVSTVGSGGLTISGGVASVTYEVVYSNPNVIEEAVAPVTVAYISNVSSNLPTPTPPATTAAINFAPAAGTNTVAAAEPVPIPRFCTPYVPGTFFNINLCTCNLLFPFVTNQVGFDTGIAIANTSLDPYGTAPQAGTITVNFYGNTVGGGAAPAALTTASIAAGTEYVTNLSTIAPGFQGYLITQARFQYCHGFAFISDIGATKLAEGYLAIELDEPFQLVNGITRTKVSGEVQAH
jgi:hypothetical protein